MVNKINLLDGGMIFELNKHYNDFGQKAVIENEKLITSIYNNYINIGCKYITTCNYGFIPSNVGDDWYTLTSKSIKIMEQFKSENVKIMGCVPPYFKSYHQGDVDAGFIEFYSKLIDIFKGKIDYYLIETNINYKHAEKIVNLIQKKDVSSKIIVSIYPNEHNKINHDKYLNLDVFGLFLNCCSFGKMLHYYNKYWKGKLNSKVFGFYCNKINESDYKSSGNDVKNLLTFLNNDYITKEGIHNFITDNQFRILFIGGCCGYGVKEMKELKNILPIEEN